MGSEERGIALAVDERGATDWPRFDVDDTRVAEGDDAGLGFVSTQALSYSLAGAAVVAAGSAVVSLALWPAMGVPLPLAAGAWFAVSCAFMGAMAGSLAGSAEVSTRGRRLAPRTTTSQHHQVAPAMPSYTSLQWKDPQAVVRAPT